MRLKWSFVFNFCLFTILLVGCVLADRAKMGFLVHNTSGTSIEVVVSYGEYQEKFRIENQKKCLILWDFVNGGDRSPKLREDVVSLMISDELGLRDSFTRNELLKVAQWDRLSRRWLLTVVPRHGR